MTQQPKYTALRGGLDLVTPAFQMEPGRVIACSNYEAAPRGYRRVDGFEIYDGQPKPSEAQYWVLNFDQGTAAITEGQTVTGLASGATGKALIDAVVTSGSYGGGDAAGYLVLTTVSSTSFQDDEELQVSAATKCYADGVELLSGAATDTNHTTWSRDAIDTARALINPPSGSGKVLGVWMFSGVAYAFRNNAGGTAAVMHKSSSSGWSTVSLGRRIAFTSGSSEISVGDQIQGATSSATATVTAIYLTGGDWTTSDAAGWIFFASQTGTFQSENLNIVTGASNAATIGGDSAAISLTASGRYEFVTHNFFGATNQKRMYGVSGVHEAFEFDGTTFVTIDTGMTTDTPNHIAAHHNHLFLSFPGGSIQHSATALPRSFEPVLGANEIALGEDVTAMVSATTGTLTVLGNNKVAVLYGYDENDWQLEVKTYDAGGKEWSAVNLNQKAIYVDDLGIRDIMATQAFGDYRMGAISRDIEPYFRMKRKAGATIKASCRVRTKDQYLLFYSDGTGISVYFGRDPKEPELMIFDLGVVVETIASCEDSSGNEIILFGDSDGNVYELNAGTSFNGEEVAAYLRLAHDHAKSPTFNKVWRKATVELDAAPSANIGVNADYGYGDPNLVPDPESTFAVAAGGGFWDEDNWYEFYYDSPVVGKAEAWLNGYGQSISLTFISTATYEAPHTFQNLALHYSMRGMKR